MGFAQGYAAAANAKLGREKLQMEKDRMDLELKRSGYTNNNAGGYDIVPGGAADATQKARDVQMQEIAMQGQAMKSLQGRLAANSTDYAIEDFMESGDADVFQKALNNDPFLRQAWQNKGVQLVTNVDFANDGLLLENAGITKDYLANPEALEVLKKSIWKYHDGKQWNIGLLNQLVAETGALRRASTKRGNMIVEHMGRLKSAMSNVNVGLEEQKANTNEYKAETGRSQLDVNKAQVNLAKTRLAFDKDKQDENSRIEEEKLRIAEQKLNHDKGRNYDLSAAGRKTAERQNLLTDFLTKNNFNSVQDLRNIDWNSAEGSKLRAEASVFKEYNKKILTTQQNKVIAIAAQLKEAGEQAGKIGSDKTGLYDDFKTTLSKYLSDDTTGLTPKLSYQLFDNIFKVPITGTAVNAQEFQANKALGTVKNKLGPALNGLKVKIDSYISSMRQSLVSLEAVNPVYAYSTLEPLLKDYEQISAYIGNRLDNLSGTKRIKSGNTVPEDKARPSLDDLFQKYGAQ